MLSDAGKVPRGTTIATDICIVGGGPAGISVALRLARFGRLRVTLLESGGLGTEPATQQLNRGTSTGLRYYDLTETRHRALGGGSNLWPGWCRPLDSIDFAGRPWVSGSGWPVDYREFRRYYEEAARLCQLGSEEWAPSDATELPPIYLQPFVGGDVEIALWQGSPPTRFGSTYRADLDASPHVKIILHATAVQIESSSDGGSHRATGVRVATLDGNEFKVAPRAIVVAAGALETTRLLLASRSTTAAGLGNENGNVGRYFMEHPHLVTGRLELFRHGATTRPRLAAIDRGITGARARLAMQRPAGATKVAYTISASRQARDHLLNYSTHLQTVSRVNRDESETYEALKLIIGNLRSPRALARQIRQKALPVGIGRLAAQLLKGAPEVASVAFREALRKPRELALYSQTEQVPNRDSRVTLDTSCDVLGMPRLRLDWRLSRIDKESVMRSQAIVGNQLERAGLGKLVPERAFTNDSPDWGDNLRGGHHHLGTARMAAEPRHGVVDPSGEVHTVRDLFIADSAVFPSGGYANPMLTIVAWALRLADTLEQRYG